MDWRTFSVIWRSDRIGHTPFGYSGPKRGNSASDLAENDDRVLAAVKTKKARQARPTKRTYRLVPGLVPRPLWGRSAYRILGRGASWRRIRQDTLESALQRCAICNRGTAETSRPLTCHEVWQYDDENNLATLVGFEAHCSECDLVVHMGLTIAHGMESRAIEQLKAINKIDAKTARRLYDDAMVTWEKRNLNEWQLRVSGALLQKYPDLRKLVEPGARPLPLFD
jgi:hypothetical protein